MHYEDIDINNEGHLYSAAARVLRRREGGRRDVSRSADGWRFGRVTFAVNGVPTSTGDANPCVNTYVIVTRSRWWYVEVDGTLLTGEGSETTLTINPLMTVSRRLTSNIINQCQPNVVTFCLEYIYQNTM